MGSGAFNVSQLIAELGLKPAIGEDVLRVLSAIQPTMAVGDLSDVTPPHVPPSVLFGDPTTTAAAQHSTVEIQCLGEGGAFVDWLVLDTVTTSVRLQVRTTLGAAATVVPPTGVLSRDPIRSIARQDPGATITGPWVLLNGQTTSFLGFGWKPMFIPRGSVFVMQAAGQNQSFAWGLMWREVPASEHVPS